MKYAVLDIETDLSWKTIWLAGVYLPESGKSIACYNATQLKEALASVSCIVGHNIINFDLPRLEEIWGFTWKGGVKDTLLLGRLYNPAIDGGHSLKQWALRAGKELKDEFDAAEFDAGWTQEMEDYCLQDCRATWDVLVYVTKKLDIEGFSEQSRQLENDVARIISQQERNGFRLDFDRACQMHDQHKNRQGTQATC